MASSTSTLDRPTTTRRGAGEEEDAKPREGKVFGRFVIGDGNFDRQIANACSCNAGDDNPY